MKNIIEIDTTAHKGTYTFDVDPDVLHKEIDRFLTDGGHTDEIVDHLKDLGLIHKFEHFMNVYTEGMTVFLDYQGPSGNVDERKSY